jgi:hypothetical protein
VAESVRRRYAGHRLATSADLSRGLVEKPV